MVPFRALDRKREGPTFFDRADKIHGADHVAKKKRPERALALFDMIFRRLAAARQGELAAGI